MIISQGRFFVATNVFAWSSPVSFRFSWIRNELWDRLEQAFQEWFEFIIFHHLNCRIFRVKMMCICVKNGEAKHKNWNLNKWRSENQKVKNKSGKVKNKNERTLWPPWGLVDRKRVGLAGRFAAILEHSGQLKNPGLDLLQNPGCLSGEIMTQTKKRKATETVRGYKMSKQVYKAAVKSVLLSVMFSNTLFQKNSTYPWVYFSCGGNVNFLRHFFPNSGNPARPLSRITPGLYAPRREFWLPWKRLFAARRRNDSSLGFETAARQTFHSIALRWSHTFSGKL